MLLHLVIFKYRADVDAATKAQHRERLAALTHLDGVIDLKVGEDVVRSPRSYDTGLAITFPDRASLDASASPRGRSPGDDLRQLRESGDARERALARGEAR